MSERMIAASEDQPVPEQATSAPSAKRRWRLSRRGFLIGLGIVGGGLALGYTLGLPYLHLEVAEMLDSGSGAPATVTTDPSVWFEVLPDNRVRLSVAKIEMGQGIHTSLAQIAAEELGVSLVDLEVVQATTSIGPQDDFGTSGSISVSSTYTPLRQAAATLRTMLAAEAATVLGVSVSQLVQEGPAFVVQGDSSRRVDFVTLAANQSEWEVPEEEVPLKDFRLFEVIGQPLPRVDIPAKVTGEAIYGYDMRVAGMKYGVVLRPPTIEGKLKAVNAGAAQDAPGVVTVVAESDFAGVVADSRAAAYAAATQMDVTWDEGRLWQQAEIDEMVIAAGRDGVMIQREGNAPRLLQEQTTHSAEYRSPLAIQTPLEAQAALADVKDGKARVWVSTQMQGRVQAILADALSMKPEDVEVIPTYIGGGFGRKSGFDVAVEAARLAKAAGVPVHVGWNRTEELRHGYLRPPTHHQLFARLGDDGRIEALEHRQASGDVAFGFLPGFMQTVMGADFGATRGARIHYAIPNRSTVAYRRQLPVTTGWWRGLGLLANTFAIESFMDELAVLAGVDPLQYRLMHEGANETGRRMRAVLEKVGELSNWGSPLPAGRERGVACCFDAGTAVAQVAEVSYDDATGKVRVHDFYAAMDCGLVINPDGARAQVEGNIMWGCGSALLEEATVQDGRIVAGNFDAYPLLTMKEAPHVEVALLEAGDGLPRGVGEPPIGPVAAAIGNAFYALKGARLRQIPFTPDRVRAARG
jgi:isoquinoline 1-oxidoreductase beta subunit